MVINYKTGFLDVEHAETNWQIVGECGCVFENELGLNEFMGVLIHPNTSKLFTNHWFDFSDLTNRWSQLKNAAILAKLGQQKRTPHPKACGYCRGKKEKKCPEYKSHGIFF